MRYTFRKITYNGESRSKSCFERRRFGFLGLCFKPCTYDDVRRFIGNNFRILKYRDTDLFLIERKYKFLWWWYWGKDDGIHKVYESYQSALDAIWKYLVEEKEVDIE